MNKIYPTFFCLLAITLISLVLLSSGCINQPERVVVLDKKLNTLSKSVDDIEPEINVLRDKLDTQQSGIGTILNTQSTIKSHLEEGLAETEKMIDEIKKNLVLIDEDKEIMKAQLDAVGPQIQELIAQIEDLRTQLEGLGGQLQKLESVSKPSDTEISRTNELLDSAIKLYRQDKFEDAILKWEEVLAYNPDKLDAEFNIEIAKDRIKQKQIHAELKSLLIQRK
ncbi:hypothetical protein SCALIN_C28_0177 [Candidatus Scalindua japonica]|uniref:Tetratricopeptide repeat protein n=1 Tax=Candidatus Scalindua japonica TaxID=1284222 RepID=A0A286U1H1_9BACT|nr:hypothetical protein [Candidatus Scalindua japonica]GAX61975.1 hypothetical protein SCALIN_C28_0177 [Candidatus Scalindua japonica]